MKFASFIGCNIPARVSQYAEATAAIFRQLNIELVEFEEFNCCGYPVKNVDHRAFVLSAARNLAVAEAAGLEMMAMCKCCYGALKKAENDLNRNQELRKDVNRILKKDKLQYTGRGRVHHLLSVLHRNVGLERLKPLITKTYSGLQIAISYGCHALRPSKITEFDDPVSPVLFDELVELTGAYSVDWTRKLDCCGAPLTGINDALAMDMMKKKVTSAHAAGAHYICIACPYTQLQFDQVQHRMAATSENWVPIAPILYPQLLGLCMEIDEHDLGLSKGSFELTNITSFLMSE